MNFRPVGKNIVLHKRDDTEQQSKLLIVVSEEKPEVMYADVLAVGPEVTDVKTGDVIATNYYAGAEYQGHIFLDADAVLFVVESD